MVSTSPRSLRRPEPQVMDWSKPSPFHVPCVRCCVGKSTPTILYPHRPCFPPRLQGCAQPKPRVPTFFDPLSSSTGGENGSVFGARTHSGNKGDHRVQTRSNRHRTARNRMVSQRYTDSHTPFSFKRVVYLVSATLVVLLFYN